MIEHKSRQSTSQDQPGQHFETFRGYVDLEATEQERFKQLDGVGDVAAGALVRQYGSLELAADHLLGCPLGYHSELGKSKCDSIREELETLGFKPPCGCHTHKEVDNSQARDDVLSYCRTCGEVIHE